MYINRRISSRLPGDGSVLSPAGANTKKCMLCACMVVKFNDKRLKYDRVVAVTAVTGNRSITFL